MLCTCPSRGSAVAKAKPGDAAQTPVTGAVKTNPARKMRTGARIAKNGRGRRAVSPPPLRKEKEPKEPSG